MHRNSFLHRAMIARSAILIGIVLHTKAVQGDPCVDHGARSCCQLYATPPAAICGDDEHECPPIPKLNEVVTGPVVSTSGFSDVSLYYIHYTDSASPAGRCQWRLGTCAWDPVEGAWHCVYSPSNLTPIEYCPNYTLRTTSPGPEADHDGP